MDKKQNKLKRYTKFTYNFPNRKDDGKTFTLVQIDNDIKAIDVESKKEIELIKTTSFCRERRNLDKREKIIAEIYNTTHGNGKIENEIFQFDYLVAIDTNTVSLDSNFFSVGALVSFGPIPRLNLSEITEKKDYKIMSENFWYFINESNTKIAKIEQFVWACTIKLIEMDCKLKNLKIGLVVDSDISEHKDINMHKKKIANSIFLPENFTLIYASADNKDNTYNELISKADTCSKKIIKMLKEKQVSEFNVINFQFSSPLNKIDIKGVNLKKNLVLS